MERALILETTFLVDLEREARREEEDVLARDRDVAWRYGRTFRYLRDQGLLIGTNDLWTAATALAHEMPLVTRNDADFKRIPELDVRSY